MNISYGKIATSVVSGIKVMLTSDRKIGFSKDGFPPDYCSVLLDDKNEISPEALADYLDYFKENFKRELLNEIFASKLKKCSNKIQDLQKDFI